MFPKLVVSHVLSLDPQFKTRTHSVQTEAVQQVRIDELQVA